MANPKPTPKTRDTAGLEPHSEADEAVTTLSGVTRDTSLFDQFADDSDPDSPKTVEPDTNADDVAALDEHRAPAGIDEDARELEKARLKAALRANPDRRSLPMDRETWDDNRHAEGNRREG
jgi:hypothetical protein